MMNSKLTAAYLIDITYTTPEGPSVTHPANIASKFKFSQQELIDYNDFIESVVSNILNNGFDIIDERQSDESYSYYITFYPTDEDGQRWDKSVQIRFRIVRPGVTTCIKSFELGTAEYPRKIAIYKGVREVCNNLRYGDYSDFD